MIRKKYVYLTLFLGPFMWSLVSLQAAEFPQSWEQKEITKTATEITAAQKIAHAKQVKEAQEKAQEDDRRKKKKFAKARYSAQKTALSAIAQEIAIAVVKMKKHHPRFAFKAGLELFTHLRTRGLELREQDETEKELAQFQQQIEQRISALEDSLLSIQPIRSLDFITERDLICWSKEYNEDNLQTPFHTTAYDLLEAYYSNKSFTVKKGHQCAMGFLYSLLCQWGITVDQDALGEQAQYSERICSLIGPFCGVGVGSYEDHILSTQYHVYSHTRTVPFCGLCYGSAQTRYSTSSLAGPYLSLKQCCYPCCDDCCPSHCCSHDCNSETAREPVRHDMSKLLTALGLGEPKDPMPPE